MSETKTVVLTLRVSPAVMALLEARAAAERRPARSMATMLLEDALAKQRLAHVAPLMPVRPTVDTEVTPRFRPAKKKRRTS